MLLLEAAKTKATGTKKIPPVISVAWDQTHTLFLNTSVTCRAWPRDALAPVQVTPGLPFKELLEHWPRSPVPSTAEPIRVAQEVFLSMCIVSRDTKACKGPTGLSFHCSDGKLTRFNELFLSSVDSSCNTKCWQAPNCVFQNDFQLCKCITSSQVTWVSSCLFCRTLITVMKAPHLESSGWQCFCSAHPRSPDTFTFC